MSTNSGRLAGKVAIITGASKGTGAVMGKQFADAGAKVLMVARREEPKCSKPPRQRQWRHRHALST